MGMPHKFGMFVHWGIYSLTGYHEQVRWRFFTPRAEYRKLMNEFNPVKYDPDEWVRLAKDAGMEYICFTTKHHDGFCMFDTKYTDFNIMNTPYHRDVLKELSEACARGGLALSLYYSNPDWDYKYGYNSHSSHQMPEKGDLHLLLGHPDEYLRPVDERVHPLPPAGHPDRRPRMGRQGRLLYAGALCS